MNYGNNLLKNNKQWLLNFFIGLLTKIYSMLNLSKRNWSDLKGQILQPGHVLGEASLLFEKIEDDFVFIKSDRKYVKIHFKDILYIEGLKDYTVLYTSDGNKFIASMNVKTIASQLPVALFARVSKSYVVNISHIGSFDNELIYIQNSEIPLGQGYKDDFIKEYIERKIVKR